MDGPSGPLGTAPVVTCDGEFIEGSKAHSICRTYYKIGFFGLPWFWATNVWLFLPHIRSKRGDPVIRSCTLNRCTARSTFKIMLKQIAGG
jgi:hypothetical protein